MFCFDFTVLQNKTEASYDGLYSNTYLYWVLDSYMVFYICAFLGFLTSLGYQFLFACLLLRLNAPCILRPLC